MPKLDKVGGCLGLALAFEFSDFDEMTRAFWV